MSLRSFRWQIDLSTLEDNVETLLARLTAARALLMDNLAYLDASISGRLSKADFDIKLPDARAALIDQITAARMAELDPANLPAAVDAILAEFGIVSDIDEVLMDGSEQYLVDKLWNDVDEPYPMVMEGYVSLSPMQAGDTIVIKEYAAIEGSPVTYRLYATHTYTGAQSEPLVHFTKKMGVWAYRVTAQQTAGTYRTLAYYFERRHF